MVPRGERLGAPKWFNTEDAARAAAEQWSGRHKTRDCKVSRVSLAGVEQVASYHKGKEVTA